ncbi:ABC transporter ATP-binding protein [Okibacterium endophyticum]
MSLLELSSVSRTVGVADAQPLTILNGVDLTVDSGERVSIVGRSGSGKSTLLNILGLLDLPTTGEVLFDGSAVASMRSRRRDRLRGDNVGFVFQQFNLLDGRTAWENVAVPLLYAKGGEFWNRERIAREALDKVGLADRANALPSSMSGGEQQRVAIARAIVRRPRLILADEPTGALDVETGLTVMEVFEEIVEHEGAALVTITHDPAIAMRSDRTFRLTSGVLEAAEIDARAVPVLEPRHVATEHAPAESDA